MQAIGLRNIKNGAAYEHLFPAAKGNIYTVKHNASLADTLAYIPRVVAETKAQTKKFAAYIKGKNVYETCRNIWEFIYNHIQYRKDEKGYEQIRSPARTWQDRNEGVDCDCYSVFISSVLSNLAIAHVLRITKYQQDHFQHIYPVVPYRGRYITMDCVTDRFDYEVPYSAKKDYPMDLQFLDGLPNMDAAYFDVTGFGDTDGELGKLILKNLGVKKMAQLPVKKQLPSKPFAPVATGIKKSTLFQKLNAKGIEKIKSAPAAAPLPSGVVPAAVATDLPQPKKKKGLKKILSKINKINPATVLLRNGILASMKLNVKKVASRLRWSYLTPQQAAQKGIDPEKFKKLLATRLKLENIFYTAGGKPENLKKAILGGKGNKDKAVSGLGMLPHGESLDYLDVHTPLEHLLGTEMYHSENVEGMEGFAGLSGLGELGEPLSMASVAAAAGVVAGIVGALKQIGDIFKSKTKGSEDFAESAAADSETTPAAATPAVPVRNASAEINVPLPKAGTTNEITENSSDTTAASDGSTDEEETAKEDIPVPATTNKPATNSTAAKRGDDQQTPHATGDGFWDKNKSWLKTTAYVGGGLVLVALGYGLLKGKPERGGAASLSGLPRHKNKKKNHHRKRHHKHKEKIAVALL
jgi:hypothetical protein